MGGSSSEREVSLSTGRQVLSSLDPDRYEAFPVDPANFRLGRLAQAPVASLEGTPPADRREGAPETADGGTSNARWPSEDALVLSGAAEALVDRSRVDVALICLHGRFGEDGTIQGMLELLGVPYTGSGVLASALAMDKTMAKKLFQVEGVPTPPSVTVRGRKEADRFLEASRENRATVTCPLVVKPSRQGSTIGISIVREPADLAAALDTALAFDEEVVIEAFVEGIEITCPVLGNDELTPLPIVEIVPTGGFYDYERKYTPGATEEIVPARISPEQTQFAQDLAIRAHRALGCRGFSRTDMIVGADGIWVLEVNTIPGMTPTSLLPRSAAAAGIPFPQLLDRMIQLALEGQTCEPTAAPVP
jgi:D-alanine-D-alanine ligase